MTPPPSWSGCCNCDSSVQMGEVLYEERVYPAGYWACVTRGEALYEQSISMGFMKLMRFICKENSAGQIAPSQHTQLHSLPPRCSLILIPPTLCVPPVSTCADIEIQTRTGPAEWTVCDHVISGDRAVLSVQVGSWA